MIVKELLAFGTKEKNITTPKAKPPEDLLQPAVVRLWVLDAPPFQLQVGYISNLQRQVEGFVVTESGKKFKTGLPPDHEANSEVYMHTHTYMYMCICIHRHMHIRMHMHMHMHIHIKNTCTYIYIYIFAHIYICVCRCVCVYIHISNILCMYTYTSFCRHVYYMYNYTCQCSSEFNDLFMGLCIVMHVSLHTFTCAYTYACMCMHICVYMYTCGTSGKSGPLNIEPL